MQLQIDRLLFPHSNRRDVLRETRKTAGFIFSVRLIHLTSLTRAQWPRVKPFHSSVDTLKSWQWRLASLTLADKSISHHLNLSFGNSYFQTAGWFCSCYLLHPKAIWIQRLYQMSFLYLQLSPLYSYTFRALRAHDTFDRNDRCQQQSWIGWFLFIK